MAAELMTLPPFERISDLWNRGQLIPFLGPGASVVGRSPHEGYSPAHPSSPPSAAELADLLASEVNFPSTDANLRTDLTLVSSYFEVMHGRGPLQNRIRELLDRDYDPAPLHKLIASFSIPQLIVVSTHDTLVEDAFRRIGKPFDVVTHSSDRREIAREVVWYQHGKPEPVIESPNQLDIDLSSTTVIYKIVGTVDRNTAKRDSSVITEEDYIGFLSRMVTNAAIPAIFVPYFRERSFLFLGYSLRDWPHRLMFKTLTKVLAQRVVYGRESHAVLLHPDKLEVAWWTTKGINVVDMSLKDFAARLLQHE